MTRFLFVGERQSPLAARTGATWQNGRLAAARLHDALRRIGLDPSEQQYTNLWTEPGFRRPTTEPDAGVLTLIRRAQVPVVALGNLVAEALTALGIAHRRMVHPAARGRIALRRRYVRHARAVLAEQREATQ